MNAYLKKARLIVCTLSLIYTPPTFAGEAGQEGSARRRMWVLSKMKTAADIEIIKSN